MDPSKVQKKVIARQHYFCQIWLIFGKSNVAGQRFFFGFWMDPLLQNDPSIPLVWGLDGDVSRFFQFGPAKRKIVRTKVIYGSFQPNHHPLLLKYLSNCFKNKTKGFQIGKTEMVPLLKHKKSDFPCRLSLKTKPRESLVVHRVYGVTHVATFQKILQPSYSGKHLSLSILK